MLTSLKELSFPLEDVVLLFASENSAYETYFKDKFGVESHTYPLNPARNDYIPSNRPYLWMRYLQEDHSRENETYLYVDSDVIFRKLPAIPDGLSTKQWYCADTLGYTNYSYVSSRPYGDEIASHMNNIVGVSPKAIDDGMGGAQWIICKPTAEYWSKVYHDCLAFYKYYQSIKDKTNFNTDLAGGLQTWCAEMYAQVWDLAYFEIKPVVTGELSFSWAIDPIAEWEKHNIFHNSGWTDNCLPIFYKGKYINSEPFSDKLDVSPDYCSYKYVEAIKKAGDAIGIK